MSGGILPFILIMLRQHNPTVTPIMLSILRRLLATCETHGNDSLWTALGSSRSIIHMFLDCVAAEFTPELVSEEIVKSLLVEIVGTEILEENGRIAKWMECFEEGCIEMIDR